MNINRIRFLIAICTACALLFSGGCSDSSASASKSQETKHEGDPRDPTPQVLVPSADGSVTFQNDVSSIDASNSSKGYIMASYSGTNEKVKLQITGPDGDCYTYLISDRGNYNVFPLSAGDGTYSLQVLENVSGDSYIICLDASIDVALESEFDPFLYPNQYVNFDADSAIVDKSKELATDTWTDLEVVENIYNYIIKNVSYDTEKAQSVSYGYLPSVDETLASGKGICFDYAALMSAMLRVQRIPTKLQVGYSGDAYHAWISTYVAEAGWVDNIIEFDGKNWRLMDPTLAASNDADSVKEYVGDGSNYIVKYSY